MAYYRVFFIRWDTHIARAEVIDCSTDEDALAKARLLCVDHPAVEVWELGRLIGRVDAVTMPDSAHAELPMI
jgi:hypothetical protein